jgi:Na+-transporting NADH:ubiquinone oxidoreductase subunit C
LGFSNRYILLFAVGLCLVCSVLVSVMAVSLRERQEVNMVLDQRLNVLAVAGVIETGQKLSKEQVDQYFQKIEELVIERTSGQILEGADPVAVNPVKEAKDPTLSGETPPEHRRTRVERLPNRLELYRVDVPGHECWVLPIWGNGLWSTLYGYLALSPDAQTVVGITYYQHGETPGLGGEVDNPFWKAQFPGKRAYDESGEPLLTVVKPGLAVDRSYQVDGMSGATITSNGVSWMIDLWLSSAGYGTFLRKATTQS